MSSVRPTPPGPAAGNEAGEIDAQGDVATLTFRRYLRHPPAVVWDAITDPAQIRHWFMTEARIEGRKGGTVDLVTGPYRVHSTGRIVEWDPPFVYEYEWNLPPSSTAPKGEASRVRWELSPVEQGTLLVLTHRKLRTETAIVFSRGLRTFLNRLAAQLDGTPLPEWSHPPGDPDGSPSP
ncbi:MAG: SRPBCC domain-containing protein [Thermoplasmata archaeon]